MDKENTPFVVWFTGLPSAGKSTLAVALCEELERLSLKHERLDGDVVRSYFPNTGFSKADRNEHVCRIGFAASLLEKHGVSVVAAFVSPYKESREFVRKACHNFIEVHVATSVEECERRDVKGLYKKARAGEVKLFTGVDDVYEIPENPEIRIDTKGKSVGECVGIIIRYLQEKSFVM